MSAAHVRRGGAARTKPRKSAKVSVPKKIAKRLPVDQRRANRLAGLVFAAFLLAIGVVVIIALDIPAKAEGLTIVSSIISLAHALKFKVVAEGVETEEQARLLRDLSCDQMQGFLFHGVMPGDRFEALITPT